MARIRSVHPSLFTDEGWVSCSPIARLLFIGLWTDADDGGVFEWKALQIKMRLLPADNVDVQEILDELAAAGLIRAFSDGGKNYGAIKDFRKFQRPQKPRATFPIPEDLIAFVTGLGEPQPDLFADQSRTGTRISNPMERRGEEDGIGKEARSRRKPEVRIPDGFPDAEAIEKGEAMAAAAKVVLDIPRQASRFRGHAETNDRLARDWRAAWRTWVEKSIETAPVLVHSDRALTSADTEAFEQRRFRAWMEDWKRSPNQWDYSVRGPKPDEPGCQIPLSIMAEFGFDPQHRAAR